MKNTGVSPVSRTSPDAPTTPSPHSSAPAGGSSAPNPLASILSRVDITPEGILSALSKTQAHSGGLQGISNLLQSVTGNSSSGAASTSSSTASRDSTQNPASTAPPRGHGSAPPLPTSAASAASGEKGSGTPSPSALKHTPPLSNSHQQELERKGGREQGKDTQPSPAVSSSSPSTLESKIHKFLQGNPGFRAFNLGLPGVADGPGSSSNSPSLLMENLDGTPVRDEAPGTPTQDEMMDEPGAGVSNLRGPAGAGPSHNGSVRPGVSADSASLGQKNLPPFSGSESGEFTRGRSGGGHGLSPTAYRSDPWNEGTPPQGMYGEGARNAGEYRPLHPPNLMPGPQGASKEGYGAGGPGNPSYRQEDFYDGRSKGAAGRGPTAGEHYPLHPLSASAHPKNARGGDAEEGSREGEGGDKGASGSAPNEAPHYRHIETVVSTSSSGEGAPIEILGYGNRRLSGERIQTVESVRATGRGARPHPRGVEAGGRPGPAGGGWYGENYMEGANPGPPPQGASDSMNLPQAPHPHQPPPRFPFEDRSRVPYPGQNPNSLPPPPHCHIPPSNFFSSPPPPIPQLPPPPQDFLS
ncbi:hypothetical protein MATL_G00231670, partial [Megalops atlanticus]